MGESFAVQKRSVKPFRELHVRQLGDVVATCRRRTRFTVAPNALTEFFFLDLPSVSERDAIWTLYRPNTVSPLIKIGPTTPRGPAPNQSVLPPGHAAGCAADPGGRNVVPVAVTAAESVERFALGERPVLVRQQSRHLQPRRCDAAQAVRRVTRPFGQLTNHHQLRRMA